MEEIDFEQLKALMEGQTDIEIISEIKKPMRVRIKDKHYRVTGIKKRDLLEYFENVPLDSEINTIEFLRTLPENSGQTVFVNDIECLFLWFLDDNTIDVRPKQGGPLLAIHKRNWSRIKLKI